tara:strand:- start:2 stop:595 length:594 start_codon:yes stop_codon:yes gene_type:complete
MEFDPFRKRISELNQLSPKKGRALVAEPFMQDPYFKRSVVLLSEYQKEGVVGFILNHPLQITFNELLEDFPDFNAPIFLGGPVQAQSLFYIHSRPDLLEGSSEIKEGIYWNGSFDQLKDNISNKTIHQEEIKFFLGYSGWDYDQLKDELNVNSWFIQEIKSDYTLEKHTDNLWRNVVSEADKAIARMVNFPEDPSLN